MKVLEKIKTEEFITDLGYQLPARPMYKLLSGCPETLKIREGYQNGSISESEIKDFVQGLLKEFKFDDFKQALDFVNNVGEIAEKLNHHPDISISYNKVKIKIYTHKVDGLTEKDFELAEKIDEIN